MEGLGNVGVEANVGADVNAIPTSGKQKGKHGRPRKITVDVDIDQLIKELLNDIERSESEAEDLFYDEEEITRENDGTAHQWDQVDLGIDDTGANFRDMKADDSSDGLKSLQGSDSDDVGRKKWYRQFNEKFDLKIPITFALEDEFADTYVFKRALKTHAIQQGYDYQYIHNDRSRVSAICKQENCH